MHNLTKFYIGGQWVEPLSSATLPIVNGRVKVSQRAAQNVATLVSA